MTLFSPFTVNFWFGQRRLDGDTVFRNPYTNESLGPLPFNGFNGEDRRERYSGDLCSRIQSGELQIRQCDERNQACAFCYLKDRNQTLTMKGIRDEDVYDNLEFDREYYIYGYKNHRFRFE